jgi:N-acetylmuramoyl-L-alanine amidase
MTTRRTALRGMGALALTIGTARIAFGASIVAVRVWPAADYTRVTIESDMPLSQSHQLLDNPSRLVIDVDGLELSPALRDLIGKVRADDPFIAGVRAGQYQPRVVRLVIDLKQPTAPQLFTLAPVAAYQNRLVFDLYPTQERDPLLALVRDKESSEQKAAQSVQDALGEFIGQVDRPGADAAPRVGARRGVLEALA